MRRCPACDEDTDHNTYVCEFCGYSDPAWHDTLRGPRSLRQLQAQFHATTRADSAPSSVVSHSAPRDVGILYAIPITSFCDGNQLAFELSIFERKLRASTVGGDATNPDSSSGGHRPVLRFDYRPMAHDWDASVVEDEFSGDVLPANVGVLALVETRRCIEFAARRWAGVAKIEVVLPPRDHPVTGLLVAANLIPPIAAGGIDHQQGSAKGRFGAVDTVLPAYTLNATTRGVLPDSVHEGLDELVSAGRMGPAFSRHLRGAIMELADNGYRHGNGECTIMACLRNESLERDRLNIEVPLSDTAARQVHLYMSCYTLGPTLAEKLGSASEREAVKQVLAFQGASPVGGGMGLGFGSPLSRARDMAEGTIVVISGNYTRIDMPNGSVREWTTEAGLVLPGVHVCLLVPLANVVTLVVPQAS